MINEIKTTVNEMNMSTAKKNEDYFAKKDEI